MRHLGAGGCVAVIAMGCAVVPAWSQNVIRDPEFVGLSSGQASWTRVPVDHFEDIAIEASMERAAYTRAAHVARSGTRTYLRLTPTYFMQTVDGGDWVIGDVRDRFFDTQEEGWNTVVDGNCDLQIHPKTGDSAYRFAGAGALIPLQPNARQGDLALDCQPWMHLAFDAQAIPEPDMFCPSATGDYRMWLGIADAWNQLPDGAMGAGRDLPVLEVRIREWNRAPVAKSESDAWSDPGSNYQRGVGTGLAMRGTIYRVPAALLVDESGQLAPAWRQFKLNYQRRQPGDQEPGSPWAGSLADRRYQVEFMLPIPRGFDRFVEVGQGGGGGKDSSGGMGSGGQTSGEVRQAISLPLQAQVHVDSVSLVSSAVEQPFSDVEMEGIGTQYRSQGLMNPANRDETDPVQCPNPGLIQCHTTEDRIDEPVFNCRVEAWPDLVQRLLLPTISPDKHGTAMLACPHAGRISCLADFNGDRTVNGEDMGILLGAWGPAPCGNGADLTGDGSVNGSDLGILLGSWGGCP